MREMKDSGVEWIGKIPAEWKLSKIGTRYQERNYKVSDDEYMPLSVTKQGIVPRLESAAKTIDGGNRKLIKINDFVINSRSDRRGSCGISEYDGSCSLINTVLKPREIMSNKYYSFVFRSERFADEFYRWGNGIVDDLWSTKWSNMKHIYIPTPDLLEQHRIADYLDAKCTKIDTLISQEQAVIEKLKEYKQSLITQVVTKGLDPNVPMKDSGVDWIGEIPVDWQTIKLKYTSYIRARLGWRGLKADEYVDMGYIFLSAFNIVNSRLDFSDVNYIDQFRYDESPEIKLVIGDVLLVKDGAGIGKVAYVKEMPQASTVNGSIAVITARDSLNGRFLYYYFLSRMFNAYINLLKDGMGVPHLFQHDLKEIQIPFPKRKIQKQIISFLNIHCAQIDVIISKKQMLIDKLTEYKKSLIYEVVTGKKEV